MYVRGRGKIGYITGETEEPDLDDPTYATWDAENSMVMTWLVNSMTEVRREESRRHVMLGKKATDLTKFYI